MEHDGRLNWVNAYNYEIRLTEQDPQGSDAPDVFAEIVCRCALHLSPVLV